MSSPTPDHAPPVGLIAAGGAMPFAVADYVALPFEKCFAVGRKKMRLLAIGLGLVAVGFATQASAEESRSDLFSQQPGRYQIVINPQARADTFLLDTATGRVWQRVQYGDLKDTPPAWQLMKRIDNDLDLKKLQREHGVKKDSAGQDR